MKRRVNIPVTIRESRGPVEKNGADQKKDSGLLSSTKADAMSMMYRGFRVVLSSTTWCATLDRRKEV